MMPAAGRAALPGVAERRERSPLHRFVEIGIVADDERVLAAELERDLRAAACRRSRAIHRPTPVEPVKLSTSTSGCSTSAPPASAPKPCTMLSTPGGSPASCAISANSQAVQRRVLGGLEHGGVAADQRRKHLPGHVGDRRVGGDDQAGDAERLRGRSC